MKVLEQRSGRRSIMKFCYTKDLNISWFVGMVERSNHLPGVIAYDDTYVYVLDEEEDNG